MRRHAAALAALSLLAAPASAQDSASPAENLDCAIWAAYLAGSSENVELAAGFGQVMTWFIGLYEGATGRPIDGAMKARTDELNEDDIAAIGARCLPRVEAFGARLEKLGAD